MTNCDRERIFAQNLHTRKRASNKQARFATLCKQRVIHKATQTKTQFCKQKLNKICNVEKYAQKTAPKQKCTKKLLRSKSAKKNCSGAKKTAPRKTQA